MNTEREYEVYIHVNKNNGKKYIGVTMQGVFKRSGYEGRGYTKCLAFWNAIKKYGWSSMDTYVVFDGLTKEEAEGIEIRLIKKLKTTHKEHGYNIQNGGNTSGTHSALTRAKIGNAHRGKKKSKEHVKNMKKSGIMRSAEMKGKGNHFYGKTHSSESRERISKGRRGVPQPSKARRVVQLGKDGTRIKVYDSMGIASRETGTILSGICETCNKNQKTSGGFKWMYLEEYELNKTKVAH